MIWCFAREACLLACLLRPSAGHADGVAHDLHQSAAEPMLLCVYCVLGCVLAACERHRAPKRGIKVRAGL